MKNISDIAKLAGVSKSTVSRFLNNGSVSKKTSEKLTKIIAEHDYQPNQFAQSLRARQTHLIGAIIPRMNSYAVDETIKGLAKQCQKYESQLILNYTGLNIEAQKDVANVLENVEQVDAVVGATDTIALAAYKYYSDKKDVMKPHQIYGFGGDPMTQLVSPSIKTIHYNYFEAGQCAMEEIQQMLKKQDMPYSVTVDVNI
ncbi:hypothetical protein AN262_10560 [Staphylococcus aureus]|uniref:LacI family DNA-binding transcriptional regulator n=1 Tax=Staphylococcus aureus TaxID=1280 RepID=UPI00244C4345|nr:LacI family DNA-binding transcriptional regulator [Staphylococcus aureus]MDH2940785.1 hypothetical protein [Staphylococcus aureus]MDH2957285.1 hypothetical protein [Staphylococcus aureus]